MGEDRRPSVRKARSPSRRTGGCLASLQADGQGQACVLKVKRPLGVTVCGCMRTHREAGTQNWDPALCHSRWALRGQPHSPARHR